MSAEQPELDPKRQIAIMALLEKPTVKEAAQQVGIADSTLHRWLREDEFSAAYRQAQRGLFDQAMGHLQHGTSEAVATLREIMRSSSAPETARVTAARTVLDFARRTVNVQKLEDRLELLEEILKAREPSKRDARSHIEGNKNREPDYD